MHGNQLINNVIWIKLPQIISAYFSIHRQSSIEYIPSPSKWTPAWTARMKELGMSSHLGYIQSFVMKSKEIQSEIEWKRLREEDWSKEEQFLQQVIKHSAISVLSNSHFNNFKILSPHNLITAIWETSCYPSFHASGKLPQTKPSKYEVHKWWQYAPLRPWWI